MKIIQHTNVNEVIGVQQQHKFKITDDSQAIIMDSLINLYSDPIGSIVREITSNCIDANRERDLKLDGKIPMEGTDDTSFWSKKQTVCIEYIDKNTILGIDECMMFHDYGCGLSEERVRNVFTTFGASTKRDNNYEIGGFGLGAKSPLAYTETFYVSSRHNGTETYYMLYRNNDNVPHMDQVYQTSTDQQNGTTVIVPIKGSYDRRKFRESIVEQLPFFQNIVFKNVVETLGEVNNYYTSGLESKKVVEETEDHIITNDGRDPFLLVGRVVYPINWDLVGIDISDFRASIGVKFDIGVLDLVPSREELRYTPKTIELILNKIKAIKTAFKASIAAEYQQITDYVEYLIAVSQLYGAGGRGWYALQSNDPKAIKSSVCSVTAFDIPFHHNPGISPGLHLTSRDFHHIFDGIHFYESKIVSNKGAIGGETIYNKELNNWTDFFAAIKNHTQFYYIEGNFSKPKSYTLINDVGNFISFKADKLKLGIRINAKSNLSDSRKLVERVATFNTVSRTLGKSSSVLKYADVKEAELESEMFGDIVDNKTRRKLDKMVFARNAEIKHDGYGHEFKYTNQEYKISDLQEMLYPVSENVTPTLKAVVYAETKNTEELEKVIKILSSSRCNITTNYRYANQKFEGMYRVVKVSKDVAKQFKNLEGFIKAEDFMKQPEHLQKFITAQRISEYSKMIAFLKEFKDYYTPENSLSTHLSGIWKELHEYEEGNTFKSCWRCEDLSPIIAEIQELDVPNEVKYDMSIIDKLEELVEYSQGLELLNFVSFSEDSRNYIENFLSLKDKTPDFEQVKQLTLTA